MGGYGREISVGDSNSACAGAGAGHAQDQAGAVTLGRAMIQEGFVASASGEHESFEEDGEALFEFTSLGHYTFAQYAAKVAAAQRNDSDSEDEGAGAGAGEGSGEGAEGGAGEGEGAEGAEGGAGGAGEGAEGEDGGVGASLHTIFVADVWSGSPGRQSATWSEHISGCRCRGEGRRTP